MRALPVLLLIPGLLTACDNACQNLCDRMARHAEEVCGIEISREEIQACKDEQAGRESRASRPVCRENNSISTIEEEWEDDELCAYWGVERDGDPAGDTDGE
jgi:hypothetical protein